MTIYFVRHGADDEGYRGGWSQRGLNVEGYRQSEKLGRYLKDHNPSTFQIQRIVSSDLQRALDTANEIARFMDLPIERSSRWRETNNGVIAGMPHEIVNERFPGLYFSSLQMEEKYPGGESPLDFYTRIQASFNQLCEEQSAKNHKENVMVVTHGGVINIVYHILKGLEWTNRSESFPASNTAWHRVEYIDGQWAFTSENMLEHL
ncbi:histidine phosphatase family protein [Saccharibacillus sp. CPCC 101409]|uniref:histidine phosphatase family protein n=1 Tax=Saccharibacillus sp. CPCC 101409 TaxID=3058041 RepID=UPI002674133B|nr:histidine phosphatase family protein [Saccharibacillus sp. CPCC 101409]MDO3410933.1 histidine phosphatase family protein [Saccharibacillus sp. CPCC 101409]